MNVAAAHMQSNELYAGINSKYNRDADDDVSAITGCNCHGHQLSLISW